MYEKWLYIEQRKIQKVLFKIVDCWWQVKLLLWLNKSINATINVFILWFVLLPLDRFRLSRVLFKNSCVYALIQLSGHSPENVLLWLLVDDRLMIDDDRLEQSDINVLSSFQMDFQQRLKLLWGLNPWFSLSRFQRNYCVEKCLCRMISDSDSDSSQFTYKTISIWVGTVMPTQLMN